MPAGARRRCWIPGTGVLEPLKGFGSPDVGAENWSRVLWQNSRCSQPCNRLSNHQERVYLVEISYCGCRENTLSHIIKLQPEAIFITFCHQLLSPQGPTACVWGQAGKSIPMKNSYHPLPRCSLKPHLCRGLVQFVTDTILVLSCLSLQVTRHAQAWLNCNHGTNEHKQEAHSSHLLRWLLSFQELI